MIKIGFVILNYLAYDATISCIQSIYKNVKTKDDIIVSIVVVDNNSYNGSYEILKNEYENNPDVTVYKLKTNVGFAKGNNYGYGKLVEKESFDYVVILNDDVEFPENGFVEWIFACKNKYNFHVLGPNVYSINEKFFQSPSQIRDRSFKGCIYTVAHETKELLKLYVNKFNPHADISERVKWDNPYCKETQTNMTLHGSILIFSREFFDYYNEPFNPKTFLYNEEDLLKLRCDRYKLKMIFDPGYTVHHLQAQSTHLQNIPAVDKMIHRKKIEISSLIVYTYECLKYKHETNTNRM